MKYFPDAYKKYERDHDLNIFNDMMSKLEAKDLVEKSFKCLDSLEKRVLKLYFGFGLDEDFNDLQIGGVLNKTSTQIYFIRIRAMRKILKVYSNMPIRIYRETIT